MVLCKFTVSAFYFRFCSHLVEFLLVERSLIIKCGNNFQLTWDLSCRFWIDTADKQPCIGTGGMIPWKLKVTGKLFHSGLAHKVQSEAQLKSLNCT